MKYKFWGIPALAMMLAACGGNTTQEQNGADSTATDSTSQISAEQSDSTLYGTATDDFGMSTFSMAVDGTSDTLYFDRGEAELAGGMRPGDRYAVTACETENGPTLRTAINLSEVERLTKDYAVANGKLLLEGKPVRIEHLSADSLAATAEDGKKIRIGIKIHKQTNLHVFRNH